MLGALVADAFSQAGWDVRRGARRPLDAPGALLVDLDRPETVRAALDGADIVVTTVPDPALRAEAAVLEHGALLLSTVAVTGEEARALRGPATGARGTVVLNAGLMPGVTNLAAAELLRAHPDADCVELAMTASTAGTLGRAGGAFGYANLRTRRRHRTAPIPLPAPYGTRRCIEFAEDSGGWLGALARGREVRTWLCFTQRLQHDALLLANALGACRALPRSRFVVEHRPGDGGPSRDPVAEWVAVGRAGRRLAAMTVECEGDYGATAAVVVTLAERLTTRELPAGAFDVHELLRLDDVAAALAERGVRVMPRSVR